MSDRTANPLTIFHLVPANAKAEAVLKEPHNLPFVSFCPAAGRLGLEIGYHIQSRRGSAVVAEVGRAGDLQIVDKYISRVHFVFERHSESNVIMLFPLNRSNTDIKPFGFGPRSRKLALQRGVKYQIGFGGGTNQKYKFDLHWAMKMEQEPHLFEEGYQFVLKNPRSDEVPWTTGETPQNQHLRSWYNYSHHTPQNAGVQRVGDMIPLGRGHGGTTFRAMDYDSGCFVAVKKRVPSAPSSNASPEKSLDLAEIYKRSALIYSTLSHSKLVECLGLGGWDTNDPFICATLKESDVGELFTNQPMLRYKQDVLNDFCFHMLQALDYLASMNLIHRNVRPEKVLYTTNGAGEGKYLFQLTGFGITHETTLMTSDHGPINYLAPEVVRRSGPQTSKMDVWSLFVTMLWIMDLVTATEVSSVDQGQWFEQLKQIADEYYIIGDMGREDPSIRYSAAQMLLKRFEGKGLTTSNVSLPSESLNEAFATSAN